MSGRPTSQARLSGVGKRAVKLDLDANKLVRKTTSNLRDPSSLRLDAKRIAHFYGEPLERFADALGISVARLKQHADAKNHQPFLRRFEQTARIAPMLRGKVAFATWLKTPNAELEGSAPIQFLWGDPKRARKLVELIEEAIVGQPD
jgi:hypothetical protein